MKPFMDEDFLLNSDAAKVLYHDHAKHMPIVDYHCHIDPKEIAEDRRFENIAQMWLSADHYKWRLMRAGGVSEEFITGGAGDFEKFYKFAEIMPKAVGNPVYHWAHLELRRYFDCDLELNADNARAIWDMTGEQMGSLTAKSILRCSNVKVAATTDDPADSLEWHEAIRSGEPIETAVVPTFRPDLALSPEKEGYNAYLERLGTAAGIGITSFSTLCEALTKRAEHFARTGCRASDHGMDAIPCRPVTESEADRIFQQARKGKTLQSEELIAFKSSLLLFLGGLYEKLGWVMQIHYGVIRGVNTPMFKTVGPDTGFDCIGPAGGGMNLAQFLNMLATSGNLPKTVIYSLDPNDNAMIDSVIACFQDGGAKMQHGPAWWFNDNKAGMEQHLIGLSNFSLLGTFIGMLTDSRSFLSYTRHEYFRRILCDMIGNWAERGEIPYDRNALGKLVEDISYNNSMTYFSFENA